MDLYKQQFGKVSVDDAQCSGGCALCPRQCHVDRSGGEVGYCGQTEDLSVARAALHMWEEPCISGEAGSGTVFFSGCTLGCVYCQNHSISMGHRGEKIPIPRLSEIFLELQGKGACNINLVTPDHFVPQIVEAVKTSREKGLTIPVVYNSSGYVGMKALKALAGLVDIYLPDMKYMDSRIGKKYSNCDDYFRHASEAISEMVRQVGDPVFDESGMMKKGVIVRHLTLPGCLEDSKNIIQYLYQTYGDAIYISIMNQYTPMTHVRGFPELDRKISNGEYEKLVEYAISLGVTNGFIQEGETAMESFIPDFDGYGVLTAEQPEN